MWFMAGVDTVCGVSSLTDIRRGVRLLRRELEVTLDTLSERSGVDRAAIHKIENTTKYPTYEPGVDTLRRLIEGLGFTLYGFFARLTRTDPRAERVSRTADDHTLVEARQSAVTLLDGMNLEGVRTATGILESLKLSFPLEQPPQRLPLRNRRTPPMAKRTARGKP